MFSIQKYFSHDAKFFDLLEASADETRELTRLLIDLLKDRSHAHPLHEFAQARGKDKHIACGDRLVLTRYLLAEGRKLLPTSCYSTPCTAGGIAMCGLMAD
jgi:hypothetical protein